MTSRCMLGCPPQTRAKLSHRFPNPLKYPNQHAAWLKYIPEEKKENFQYNKHRICDKHFLEKDKYFNKLLNRIAIPVLCLPGQPSTHNNCDCDSEFAGFAESTINDNNAEVKDEHDYTTKITEQRKYTSLLEKEHNYHSEPQADDKTLDYKQESGNATSTCIKLLDRYDDFGKIATESLTPTEIEDATNVAYALEETLNNVFDKPQSVLSDDDVVKEETEKTKPQNQTEQSKPQNQTDQTKLLKQTEQSKKTKNKKMKKSSCKMYIPFIRNPFKQNSSKTCTTSNSNRHSNVTDQLQPLVIDFTVTENTSSAKTIQNTKTLNNIQNNIIYSVMKCGRNIFLTDCISNGNISELPQENSEISTTPKICMTDTNSDEHCISDNDFPNNAIGHQTVVPQPVLSKTDIADQETEDISIVKINSDRLFTLNNIQSNVTGQVQPLVRDVRVTEITSSAKAIQNTKTLHNTQKKRTYLYYPVKSRPVSNANISKVRQENTEISTTSQIYMTDTNSDDNCISDNDFPNNAIGYQTVVPQPVLSNADIADHEMEDISNAKVNSLQNTITLHNTQKKRTYLYYPVKSRLVSNANISNVRQENTENSTTPKIYITDTNSDEHYISDNDFPNNAIGRLTVVPHPVLSNADIADLDSENTSIAEENSNTLIPVRIYDEANSTSGSSPGSPKRAKLNISDFDEYRIVGSTTVVTGYFESDEIQPLEDPLAIPSQDIDIDNTVGLIEDSMSSNEDSVGSGKDSMGAVEDSIGCVEDGMKVDKDSSNPLYSINDNDNISDFEEESEDDIDIQIKNEDDLEVAFALKYIFKQGKTAEQAFEEIMSTYGPGKVSLKEAECWFKEFDFGNDVLRLLSSGGPVYK